MNKKITRRISMFILSLVICFSLMPMTALAQGAIDLDKDVKLTIHYQYDHHNVEGVPFSIYRVADVSDLDTVFTLSGDFASAPVLVNNLDAEGWKIVAETLTGYAQSKGVASLCSGQTDSNGILTFPTGTAEMKAGLYLVVSPRTRIGSYVYTTEPFLVSLPDRNNTDNTWDYSLTVNPKCVRNSVPDEPTTISRKALKVWDDKGYESTRPKEITVYLLRNGVRYDTVKLNKDNNWKHTWNGLSSSAEWRVVEAELDKYTTTVTQEGITFVITNSYKVPDNPPDDPSKPPKPPGPKLPQTGTTWYLVPILVCVGLVFIILGVWLHRREKHEM